MLAELGRVLSNALPPLPAPTFSRRRFASLQVRDQVINPGAIQRPLSSQDNRQRDHDIAIDTAASA
jgi:hypothetical protein